MNKAGINRLNKIVMHSIRDINLRWEYRMIGTLLLCWKLSVSSLLEGDNYFAACRSPSLPNASVMSEQPETGIDSDPHLCTQRKGL